MFGYIVPALDQLPKDRQKCYRAYYCGLCHCLKERYGQLARMTLSYDMTFLYILLSSLYEPETKTISERCLPHAIQSHTAFLNEIADYCCDMNVILSYYKLCDDWKDERHYRAKAGIELLFSAYETARQKHEDVCGQIERALESIGKMEKGAICDPDFGANQTGAMLGRIYCYKNDFWKETLYKIGSGIGRFIYIMDAYDDAEKDKKQGLFNPLSELRKTDNYETVVKDALSFMMAEATVAFEELPIVRNADILRNILYAGCWMGYQKKQNRLKQVSGAGDMGKNRRREINERSL